MKILRSKCVPVFPFLLSSDAQTKPGADLLGVLSVNTCVCVCVCVCVQGSVRASRLGEHPVITLGQILESGKSENTLLSQAVAPKWMPLLYV